MIRALTPIIAIFIIGMLVALALYKDINGLGLAGGLALIGGLGGFGLGRIRN